MIADWPYRLTSHDLDACISHARAPGFTCDRPACGCAFFALAWTGEYVTLARPFVRPEILSLLPPDVVLQSGTTRRASHSRRSLRPRRSLARAPRHTRHRRAAADLSNRRVARPH